MSYNIPEQDNDTIVGLAWTCVRKSTARAMLSKPDVYGQVRFNL